KLPPELSGRSLPLRPTTPPFPYTTLFPSLLARRCSSNVDSAVLQLALPSRCITGATAAMVPALPRVAPARRLALHNVSTVPTQRLSRYCPLTCCVERRRSPFRAWEQHCSH